MSILVAAAGALGGCGGAEQQQEYREAAVVAGVAAVAQVVQTARAQAPDAKSQANAPGPCCAVCRTCEFPCGDRCVLYGTICTEPAGCACTDTSRGALDPPVDTSVPPYGCPAAPSAVVPAPGI